LFISFGGIGYARKAGALWLEPHLQSKFALVNLEMEVSPTICSGWPQTTILQMSASQVAWITDGSHWRPAHIPFDVVVWMCQSLTIPMY
jgi:hypothetical protein